MDKKKPKPTIIFLQGSLAKPIIFHDSIGASVTAFPFEIDKYLNKFNFIIIPRYGIPLVGSYEKDTGGYLDKNGKIPIEYIKNDNLKYRTFQAKTVLNYLYKQKWVQKDSIFVIGHSEGYRVAAKLSENNRKIAKLVCMSANPFNRIAEYVLKSRIETLFTPSDSLIQKEIDMDVDGFKNISKNIETYKNDQELYNRMSYNNVLSYESFLKFKNPILVTYGTEDLGSLNNDLLPFLLRKTNLTMFVYPDLDHNYNKKEVDKNGNELESSYHWDDVFNDIQNWLLTNSIKK
jgi:dienelactone hydrolase